MSNNQRIGTWITPHTLPRQRKIRLVCLPYAGGGASMYRAWAAPLAEHGIDVCALHLPGRESRFGEAPISEMPQLVARICDEVAEVRDGPVAVFGVSMGALIGFELARELRRSGRGEVRHLFVCACRAPHLPDLPPLLHALPFDELIEELRRFGGTPEELLADPEYMQPFVRMIRADAKLTELYRYMEEAPLECPITTYAGRDDLLVPPDAIHHWQGHTTAAFQEHVLPGGHFVVRDSSAAILHSLREHLRAA